MSETIVNGIDVSECEYINCCSKKAKCVILQDDILSDSQYCESEPNYYFKQLKRLQEENEELKKKLQYSTTWEYLNKVNRYKQALEEIKKWTTNHNPCDIEAGINCTKEDCFECLNYDIKKITKIVNEVLNDRD